MTERPPKPQRPARPAKPSEWRRWVGIVLRSAHLAGVVWLGAALMGAPVGHGGGWLTLASGLGLFASELIDRRVAPGELAGALVIAKLGVVGAMLHWPTLALPLFWILLAVSAVSAHAPKPVRHWRPGRRG